MAAVRLGCGSGVAGVRLGCGSGAAGAWQWCGWGVADCPTLLFQLEFLISLLTIVNVEWIMEIMAMHTMF